MEQTYGTSSLDERKKSDLEGQTLTWGILGLVFAFVFSILGIFFSRKGLNLAKSYEALYGQVAGRAKVGKILAKIGFIVSIVYTAISAATIAMYVVGYGIFFLLLFSEM